MKNIVFFRKNGENRKGKNKEKQKLKYKIKARGKDMTGSFLILILDILVRNSLTYKVKEIS